MEKRKDQGNDATEWRAGKIPKNEAASVCCSLGFRISSHLAVISPFWDTILWYHNHSRSQRASQPAMWEPQVHVRRLTLTAILRESTPSTPSLTPHSAASSASRLSPPHSSSRCHSLPNQPGRAGQEFRPNTAGWTGLCPLVFGVSDEKTEKWTLWYNCPPLTLKLWTPPRIPGLQDDRSGRGSIGTPGSPWPPLILGLKQSQCPWVHEEEINHHVSKPPRRRSQLSPESPHKALLLTSCSQAVSPLGNTHSHSPQITRSLQKFITFFSFALTTLQGSSQSNISSNICPINCSQEEYWQMYLNLFLRVLCFLIYLAGSHSLIACLKKEEIQSLMCSL